MFCLVALVLYLLQFYDPYVTPVSISPLLLGTFAVMSFGEAVSISRMWNSKPALVSVLLASLTATLLSLVRVIVYPPSSGIVFRVLDERVFDSCPVMTATGFPFPWSFSLVQYYPPPQPPSASLSQLMLACPKPVIPDPSQVALPLLLDIAFYAAITLGILELSVTLKRLLPKRIQTQSQNKRFAEKVVLHFRN